MRTNLDFTPFARSSVGFDRLFSLLDQATTNSHANSNSVPYEIARTAEDAYRIVLAVPGYDLDDLQITQQANVLTITGRAGAAPQQGTLYSALRRGDFSQRFHLADHVDVTDAELKNGLLSLSLKQEVPETMKPRQIQIGSKQTLIEDRKAA
jgi:molecular chaperone IbpA